MAGNQITLFEQPKNNTQAMPRINQASGQTITSLEIAEITGKLHKHVLEATRVMEPAWEKVHGRKFSLMFKISKMPN